MEFLNQVWALIQKDLILIVRRRWFSTLLRALILPIVYTIVIAEIKNWTSIAGNSGIGSPSPVRSLSDALPLTDSSRYKAVIVDNGFKDGDIATVVKNLSTILTNGGKELHVVPDDSQLASLCPSSNGGVSSCFGAVTFESSPNHGGKWNYTMHADSTYDSKFNAHVDTNYVQVYLLPFQRAIDSAIAATNQSKTLPEVMQYPFTYLTDAQAAQEEQMAFQDEITFILAFAYFVGLAGLIYHCVGHICHQREDGILELIDSMMPNRRRWEIIAARILSTHLAFDLIYLPSWIVMGAALPAIIFDYTNIGYVVALYILCGLSLTSFSILASSFFRKSQVAAGVAIIVALVLALAAQFGLTSSPTPVTGAAWALAVLFPPCAYVFFLIQAAGWEMQGIGLRINEAAPSFEQWSIPASAFLGLFVFHIFVYPVLGAVIEKYVHGTSNRNRTVGDGSTMNGVAVKLQNFSKHFRDLKDKKKTVKAVDDVSLNIYAGSITVLLGANGSGKSTTLNCIANMESITSGSIEIDGTGGLGICPQKNIMWGLLTVREHIEFFLNLKHPQSMSRADRKAEVDRLIAGCDLEVKEKALSKTLSGGQKRKLQLAMMLAGGSKVCCIDEASSGIDPIARRKVWDILLAERGARTLLFTTHFLDEAEGLADHVAILSKGHIKAEGSVATLKRELGGGFQLVFPKSNQVESLPLPTSVKTSTDYNHTMISAPDSTTLSSLVATLEQRGVTNYRVEGPTIEKAFLKLAEEMRGDSDLARELRIADEDSDQEKGSGDGDDVTLSMAPSGKARGLSLDTGRGVSPLKQTWIMFMKRVVILKHNYMPYICALIVSLAVAGLVTRFFKDPGFQRQYPNGIPCAEKDQFYTPYRQTIQPQSFYGRDFVWGPANSLSPNTLQAAIPNTTTRCYYDCSANVTSARQVDTRQQFNDFVLNNTLSLYDGGLFYDPSSPLFVYQEDLVQAMALQSVLHNVILNETIYWGYQPFQTSFTPDDSITSLVAVFTILGFALYPGFFALYPTAERIRKVRAMHYSNGIRASSIWAAHAAFDFMFVLLISVLSIAIWVSQWNGWYAPGYMFVCFFLYGLAGTAFSYIMSIFVSSQLAAFAVTSLVQVIVAGLYYLGYLLASDAAPTDQVYNWFNYIHYTIGLFFPVANLGRAVFMTLNQYSLICHGLEKASYPGEIGIYGAPILYLLVQFLVFSAFLMYWESGRSLEVFGIRTKRSTKPKSKDVEKAAEMRGQGEDAVEDAVRLAPENLGLIVSNVSKTFGKHRAVEDATFGILPSEKFALLGPNGAGKSTMISLVRGELRPDRGHDSSIDIGGNNLHSQHVAAINHLGVCPQFDATDSMTLIEHLRFYARARGVADVEGNIRELIRRLGLEEHKNKLARKLSGGTKRKLSLAIALVANPSVLLLDEPSSGMDAAARRALWGTLSAISQGRVLLITTHSMEEADALCDRAGIMAGRMLALGGIEDLRARHGNAAFVHLVHRDAPYTSAEETARMQRWVDDNFPAAVPERRNFGGQMRFSVPWSAESQGAQTGRLFRLVEQAKEELGVVDYSIGPATLDQVFLNVVGKNEQFREENTARQKTTAKGVFRSVFR